jgi:hypothetical protein
MAQRATRGEVSQRRRWPRWPGRDALLKTSECQARAVRCADEQTCMRRDLVRRRITGQLTDTMSRCSLAPSRPPLPGDWPEWPGGWPGKVEAAPIDAVLSISATYGQSHNGVRGAIQRWQAARDGGALDDLTVLASCAPPSLLTSSLTIRSFPEVHSRLWPSPKRHAPVRRMGAPRSPLLTQQQHHISRPIPPCAVWDPSPGKPADPRASRRECSTGPEAHQVAEMRPSAKATLRRSRSIVTAHDGRGNVRSEAGVF